MCACKHALQLLHTVLRVLNMLTVPEGSPTGWRVGLPAALPKTVVDKLVAATPAADATVTAESPTTPAVPGADAASTVAHDPP